MVVLTRSDDMEVSELSLGLAQRGVRLVRINRDDPAGRALGALRPDGIFHGQGEWLRTQAVWVRHFWDPGVRGDADRVHEAYVQEQLNALPGTLSEVGGLWSTLGPVSPVGWPRWLQRGSPASQFRPRW